VEQLAELADTYVGKVPMGHSWKAKAAEFVLAQKDAAIVNKLQMELAERDNTIATMQNQINDLAEAITDLRKAKK
jgi:hypothetical protein